jgi:hypothetical protein
MSDLTSPLGKMQGPAGDPNLVSRYARKLRDAGGALLLKHQLDALSPATKAEIEAAMQKAYGRASKT